MIEIDLRNEWHTFANKASLDNPMFDDYIFSIEIRCLLENMNRRVSTILLGYNANPRGFETYNPKAGKIKYCGPMVEFKCENPSHFQFIDFERMEKVQFHFESEDDEALFKMSW